VTLAGIGLVDTHTHTHILIHILMHSYTHARMHAYTHTHSLTHTHTHTFTPPPCSGEVDIVVALSVSGESIESFDAIKQNALKMVFR
jgi:hypothetical protein